MLEAPGRWPPASFGNAGHIAVEQVAPLASPDRCCASAGGSAVRASAARLDFRLQRRRPPGRPGRRATSRSPRLRRRARKGLGALGDPAAHRRRRPGGGCPHELPRTAAADPENGTPGGVGARRRPRGPGGSNWAGAEIGGDCPGAGADAAQRRAALKAQLPAPPERRHRLRRHGTGARTRRGPAGRCAAAHEGDRRRCAATRRSKRSSGATAATRGAAGGRRASSRRSLVVVAGGAGSGPLDAQPGPRGAGGGRARLPHRGRRRRLGGVAAGGVRGARHGGDPLQGPPARHQLCGVRPRPAPPPIRASGAG